MPWGCKDHRVLGRLTCCSLCQSLTSHLASPLGAVTLGFDTSSDIPSFPPPNDANCVLPGIVHNARKQTGKNDTVYGVATDETTKTLKAHGIVHG